VQKCLVAIYVSLLLRCLLPAFANLLHVTKISWFGRIVLVENVKSAESTKKRRKTSKNCKTSKTSHNFENATKRRKRHKTSKVQKEREKRRKHLRTSKMSKNVENLSENHRTRKKNSSKSGNTATPKISKHQKVKLTLKLLNCLSKTPLHQQQIFLICKKSYLTQSWFSDWLNPNGLLPWNIK
jgi:hypothetical protein